MTAEPLDGETRQLQLLEGPAAAEPLQLALETLGLSLKNWSLVQIHHRPGAGATGIYQVEVAATRSPATTEFLCISTAPMPEGSAGVVQLNGPEGTALNLWQHPHDPLLPGLAWACDAAAVGRALFGGLNASGEPEGAALTLATVSYRPLRRAVMVAELNGARRYLKVLRRGQAVLMGRRFRLLANAGLPVPELIDVPADDVLAMHPAAGTPLAELIMSDGASALEPGTLIELLQRLPPEAMELPERLPWAVRVRDYAKGALAVLPEEEKRISALAEQIHYGVTSIDPGPRVPSHGDFYEANLLIAGDRVTGLLDVDALGPGHLVDDLACFIGHLAVLPALDSRYRHVPAALARFLGVFDTRVDPAALRIRAAGVALTLVAGAKRRGIPEGGNSWRTDALARLAVAEGLAAEGQRIQR